MNRTETVPDKVKGFNLCTLILATPSKFAIPDMTSSGNCSVNDMLN